MKLVFLGSVLVLSVFANAADIKDFNGATPEPVGQVEQSVGQLKIKFDASIAKKSGAEPFKVTCAPAVEGYGSWADNNTIWTYNLKAADEYSRPRLAGGSKCQVTQLEDLQAEGGKTWKAGTINYSVIIAGPDVQEVYVADGFKDTLRETEPLMMLIFNGPVDRTRFFAEQSGFLSYTSSNAPGEKIPLVASPADQSEKLFSLFKSKRYFETDFKDQNWILVTAQQNLIPGSQVSLTVQNQYSAENSTVKATKKFTKELLVRSQFQAEVQCANPSAKNATCLPRSPISVVMNGRAKWTDVKGAYIEYIPYRSTDKKIVRSYPELGEDQEVSLWASFLDSLSDYFPFLARFNDIVVDKIVFNVNIEPETQAKVVLPAGIVDIDGRIMTNAIAEFHVRIGAMSEIIHVPKDISFFEKNVPNLYLPVGIVNLNQKISIRKSGKDAKNWEPIQDPSTMIRIIRGYTSRGEYRTTPNYTSPLDQLGIKNTVIGQQLSGTKNRPSFLQFAFAENKKTPVSGFYALEVSSPTYEASRNYDGDGAQYYNPKYVLAQVTDLGVHLKKGANTTVAWVTSLSKAQPVAGADVEIYNCLGQPVLKLKTDASGLVSFPNQQWAKDCQKDENVYSPYMDSKEFFVAARTADDIALAHSSWLSPNSYALGAPGVDYFYGDMYEDQPHYHGIIGVNLVKPGQQVPVQIVAKLPNAKGFAEVTASKLPKVARIQSADDSEVFYELPLTWKNGVADITWNVPGDSSVKLGRYMINLVGTAKNDSVEVSSSDIEVAEFKVPLMSGIIAFPNQALVKPDSIPVSSVIRYANGVGAKNLAAEMSYYFEPTSLEVKELNGFNFGSGPVKLAEDESSATNQALPNSNRPATIPGLNTGADGSLTKDLALEKAADGRSIAEVLKNVTRPQKLVARVRYQDQMGEYQTLSQGKTVYNSEFYVGTNIKSGERTEARLRAAVVTTDQKNVTNLQDMSFKLIRVDVKVIGEELFGGVIKNTLERTLQPVRWTPSCALQDKVASCSVGALKAGNYAFEVTTTSSQQSAHVLFKVDSEGRVHSESDYYNFGDDEGNKQLPLALNKKSYKDGEKAIVSFPAPFKSCRALVTIERNDVMQSFISNNACEKGFVEVPVNATLAPNAFVSVYAITGRAQSTTAKPGDLDLGRPTYRLGFANMKVNWSRFKSNVTVKTDKEKYEPGETVSVMVNVTPEEGALSGGTVTLIAIEEKILELKKNNTYKILDALMQLRGHNVSTITSLGRIETVTTQNSEIDPENERKGGDEGGDGTSSSEFKRKLFNALVSFQSEVPVVNGTAKFSFKTNDSLTRFKIFVVSTDASQKFGTGEATYLTEKDTQAYSNIPSVAHTGDNFPVNVTVQNNGSKANKFKTEVVVTVKDSTGKVIGTKTLTKDQLIGSASSASIEVGSMTIDEEASRIEYVVRVYDENGKLVDVLEPDAQVILASVPLEVHDSYIVQVENNSLTKSLVKEEKAVASKGEIRVTVSKSLVSGADRQIQQRLDRDMFADFFVESKFYKALLQSTESKPEQIKLVLESLISSTDSKGFVKFYPQAERGSVWLTASILNALQQEPWAMKLAPTALQQKLQDAASQVLTKSVDPKYIGKNPMDWMRAQTAMGRAAFAFADKNLQSSAKAVLITTLAQLQKNPAAFGETIDKWSNADLLNVWLLQVVVSPAEATHSAFYQQLTSAARLVHVGNMAQLTGGPRFAGYYTDETIETSNLLAGHARLKQDKNLARALAVGLVNASQKAWYNTGTLFAVSQSLKSFRLSYEAEEVTGSAVVTVVEQQKTGTIDWSKTPIAELSAPWTQNQATVQVTQKGQGQPWVGVQALTAVPLTESRSQGISVDKEVKNTSRDSGFQTGDLIEVTLTVHAAGDLRHIALMDPIPAGSNIVADAYGEYSSGQKSYSGYKLYFEGISAGSSVVKYQYQLNNPGVFKLPPTRASGLYMPSIFGEAPNTTMTVK